MNCPHCDTPIDNNTVLDWKATATVKGSGTLNDFNVLGLDWRNVERSHWNEQIRCPHCGEYFSHPTKCDECGTRESEEWFFYKWDGDTEPETFCKSCAKAHGIED